MTQCQTTIELSIKPIHAFKDNYIWTISQAHSPHVVFVDPGDAKVCIQYLEKHNKILSSILITHHHADHIGGINELVSYCEKNNTTINIYAPYKEDIPHATHRLYENDLVELSEFNISFSVIELPGHTLGHIAYYHEDILFCGDTLFSGGCGRLFEGTPKQMLHSLNKLKCLPSRTRVYCTHEYTLANLEFALTVDPTNLELIEYYNQVKTLRESNKISLPSSILREKLINPFLRCSDPNISKSAHEHSGELIDNELAAFTQIRKWKDNY